MAIDAVVTSVEFAADKPFPERWLTGVKGGVPILVPVQQFGVFAEAFRKMLLAELLHHGRIIEIGLAYEFCGGLEVLFFLPMHGNLSFGQLAFVVVFIFL